MLTKEFFQRSSISNSAGTKAAMDFLSKPESVAQMISMSKRGLPALTGVVKELEDLLENSVDFPLNHNAPNANAPNRRNVGWMVRFVMKAYGYTPIASGFPEKNDNLERTRIQKFSGSKYFGTAAVYERSIPNPEYELQYLSVKR